MKKLYLLMAGLCLSGSLLAQTDQDDGSVQVIYPASFEITKPLREMVADTKSDEVGMNGKTESRDKEFRRPMMLSVNPDAQPADGQDPVMQAIMGTKLLTLPINQWNGQSGSGYPPDPSGAAGTNNYVQAVNTAYKVYTKTGGTVASGGPFNLSHLWSGTSDDGDPIVLYDKFADRWFITQFQYNSPYKACIAVSTSNDPTGTYYSYTFNTSIMPDYLKFSIWHDGYYMTANWGSGSQRIIVFERSVMLAGGASPRMLVKTYSPPNDGAFFCPLSADADGSLPAAGTPCPIFSYTDDSWGGSNTDAIKVYEMTVNWVPTTPTATLTNVATLAAAAFNSDYDQSYPQWNDVPQPGTSDMLDGIGGVFTFRAQHRVWPGYNSVVLCMGVKISDSPIQRSIRWFELRRTAGTWSIYQQGTYTPDAYTRWCGSIAMDDNGSIALVYSISGNSTVYPGIRYTGRNASDPLGTMTYSEQIAQAGTGVQTTINRWGDYSQTSLDPSDGTLFWHTGEYLSSGNIMTRIFSFRIPVPTGIETVTSESTCSVSQSGSTLLVRAEKLPDAKELIVDLFDINGQLIEGRTIQPQGNKLETSFNISNLAKGTYLVRIGEMNTSFQKVTKVIIN